MDIRVVTTSSSQTKKLGSVLAKQIMETPSQESAFVIALVGDLGGGKTTFLQGLAKGLGLKEKILSPTFVIMKRYQIDSGKNYKNFYHIDCYRVESSEEIMSLGFSEMIKDNKGIIAVEWADKVKDILPKSSLFLYFKFMGKDLREIKISR